MDSKHQVRAYHCLHKNLESNCFFFWNYFCFAWSNHIILQIKTADRTEGLDIKQLKCQNKFREGSKKREEASKKKEQRISMDSGCLTNVRGKGFHSPSAPAQYFFCLFWRRFDLIVQVFVDYYYFPARTDPNVRGGSHAWNHVWVQVPYLLIQCRQAATPRKVCMPSFATL